MSDIAHIRNVYPLCRSDSCAKTLELIHIAQAILAEHYRVERDAKSRTPQPGSGG